MAESQNPAFLAALWCLHSGLWQNANNIGRYLPYRRGQNPPPWPIFDNTDLYQQNSKDAVSLFIFQSKRKRPRTPTPGHYLGLKNTRDYGPRGGDRGRHRGGFGRDDYPYHRSPRRSPYRGSRDYSPRHSPYGGSGRYRRDRSRSPPYAPYGSPDRRYARGPR